ncbi:MAG: efflux transporter outer membrane subunit, partial [Candidatus Krumholzibacteria bacterium]|nr:efflux transporter outer membrane subunit [Candidatus Krumholzibacteria bacterium]
MKRILVKTLPLVVVAALTAGCASVPDHKPPDVNIESPQMWTAGQMDTSAVGLTEWWVSFDEPLLDELVAESLNNNYDLIAASARVDQAAALARITGADRWPQLFVSGQGLRSKRNFIGFPIPGTPPGGVLSTTNNSYGVSLDASWEIDLWGRMYKAQSAALADVEASWADLAGLRLSIASQTVKAWFAITEARLQVELAEQTVNSFRTSADHVRTRYEQGVRTSLDLRLALSNVAAAEALLEFRREQLDRTTRQLEILLGRYPAAAIEAPPALPELPGEVPGGLPSELLIRRPDLLAAERRYAAAGARVSEARRAFFPRITLTGSGGSLTQQIEDIASGDFSVWNIAAGITQPIFQGGRLRANLARSHSVSDQALAGYAGALLRAFGEVESAIVAEESLRWRVRYTAEAARQSEAARQVAERQYQAGLVDYITVLETQRRSLNSQSE